MGYKPSDKREVMLNHRNSVFTWHINLYQPKYSPTKRAPDAGDSAHISGSFLRLSLFLVGRLRRPRPSAGNANRCAARCYGKVQL